MNVDTIQSARQAASSVSIAGSRDSNSQDTRGTESLFDLFQSRSAKVDLVMAPGVDPLLISGQKSATIGDTHACLEKMCYFLSRAGVFNFSTDQYEYIKFLSNACTVLQDKWGKFTKSKIKAKCVTKFSALLEAAFNPEAAKNNHLRFLGDTLADRRSNDIFILMIYSKLHEKGVPFTVIFSNHDAEFMRWFENSYRTSKAHAFSDKLYTNSGELYCPVRSSDGAIDAQQTSKNSRNTQFLQHKSMWALRMALENQQISLGQVQMMYDIFLQHIKIVDCEIIPGVNKVVVYSHAPIGIKGIEYMADELCIEFKAHTPQALQRSIKRINSAFRARYILPRRIKSLFEQKKEITLPSAKLGDPKIEFSAHDVVDQFNAGILEDVHYKIYSENFPFIASIWNRCYPPLLNDESAFPLIMIHGHDGKFMKQSIQGLNLESPDLDSYGITSEKGTILWITLDRMLGKRPDFDRSVQDGDRITLAYVINSLAQEIDVFQAITTQQFSRFTVTTLSQ